MKTNCSTRVHTPQTTDTLRVEYREDMTHAHTVMPSLSRVAENFTVKCSCKKQDDDTVLVDAVEGLTSVMRQDTNKSGVQHIVHHG